MVALEAALLSESDFVGRRLRERAPRLLGLDGEAATVMRKRLTLMYNIRSKLAHGSPILNSDRCALKRNMPEFESEVRKILCAALINVPGDECERRDYLSALYDVTDSERVQKLRDDASSIRCKGLRDRVRAALNDVTTRQGAKQ
jgi:hypothetical protein